ncbi:uncharacterized protein LOC135466043 isoform X1 [Liolophura sinensis]|uniref:uncharacterized protein LOC135466043 isoform X1 n=2 Tax=Liolophura sinensis TaxID=3198878 RepID=UPI0031587C26
MAICLSESRVCQDPDLDVHLRKLGYSLALPAILTHVKDLHVFCKTLFLSGVVTKEELDKFFPTSRQKVACFLMNKDEKAVFNCLANPTLTAKAESMKKKAYNYVVNVVLDPPQRPPDPSSVGRYALIGLASVGVGIAAIVSAPFVIAAAGFGSGGIGAGSFAAWFMSTYGGAVSAGSLCALLQSAGAAGLAASTTAGIGAAGTGAFFGILSGIVAINKKFKKKSESQGFRDNL